MLEWTEELLRRLERRKESLSDDASSSSTKPAPERVDFTFGSQLSYAPDNNYCVVLGPRSSKGQRKGYS
jgi:hypothetical protein